jgi:AcrR family transcriptional regulator
MARPRRIDREAVLASSLEIADESGIDSVTMQAVSRRLGVTPMALYRHVESKEDLLDGVVERLLDELPAPDPSLDWTERLTVMGDAVRAVARRHPTVFPLLLQLPATTPTSRRSRDRVHAALAEAGVPTTAIPRLERLISTMVLGFAASEAGGRFRSHSRKVLDEDYAELTRIIARTVTEHLAG